MEKFSYSVAIRTLGTAGEKYEKLLRSIQNQTIQPEKIIVVLPDGYEKPTFQLGVEEFVFCEKGMITQRLEAMRYIDSDYILFSDDDIEYSKNYVELLADVLLNNGVDCAAGPLTEFFPKKSLKYACASILGGACVMLRGKDDFYVRVLNTGGWSYNHDINKSEHRVYKTESLAWTTFLIDTKVMKSIKFKDEMWLDKTGYSAFEDRVMFYKIIKNGYCIAVVSDAYYKHNDGKTSTVNLRLEPIYAASFNHYVFWHRFLYSLSKNPLEKLWMRACINYYVWMNRLYSRLLLLSGRRTREQAEASRKGFADAKLFVKSEEYKGLPGVVCQ